MLAATRNQLFLTGAVRICGGSKLSSSSSGEGEESVADTSETPVGFGDGRAFSERLSFRAKTGCRRAFSTSDSSRGDSKERQRRFPRRCRFGRGGCDVTLTNGSLSAFLGKNLASFKMRESG